MQDTANHPPKTLTRIGSLRADLCRRYYAAYKAQQPTRSIPDKHRPRHDGGK